MKLFLRISAVVGALVVSAPFVLLAVLFSQLLPLPSVLIALSLVASGFLYFWLRKRRAGSVASESSLLGRSMSKEGLL